MVSKTQKIYQQLTLYAVQAALVAGRRILEIYDKPIAVDYKDDRSPLTAADRVAHSEIVRCLQRKTPDISILSEEGEGIEYEVRRNWYRFWLVDPLDGTKEFIKRNGEFTVNIALIRHNKPVLGVVHVPVADVTYYGQKEVGAFMSEGDEKSLPISVSNKMENRVAVRSKSHPSPEEEVVLNEYQVVESISRGSSLKFCMVAEGKADIYYRHGPTMEWDTAAGQAVVEAANGKVMMGTGPEPFTYNKPSLLNSSFLCLGF